MASQRKSQLLTKKVDKDSALEGIGAKNIVDKPNKLDICCGRGKRFLSHPGNLLFQSLVRDNAHRYAAAPTKVSKSEVVASIVDELATQGARFLKRDESSKGWYEMSQLLAHDKTGHAIRDLLMQHRKKSPANGLAGERKNKRASKTNICDQDSPSSTQPMLHFPQQLHTPAPETDLHVVSTPSSPHEADEFRFQQFDTNEVNNGIGQYHVVPVCSPDLTTSPVQSETYPTVESSNPNLFEYRDFSGHDIDLKLLPVVRSGPITESTTTTKPSAAFIPWDGPSTKPIYSSEVFPTLPSVPEPFCFSEWQHLAIAQLRENWLSGHLC